MKRINVILHFPNTIGFLRTKNMVIVINYVQLLSVYLICTVSTVAYAENFHGGVLVQGRMVVICIWCWLFVTSQFDVISMFPNQRFGEVCRHNNAYFSTRIPHISCVIALNVNYQRSTLGYRRKINSMLRHSSS